jgi:signal transduction histidine kinase
MASMNTTGTPENGLVERARRIAVTSFATTMSFVLLTLAAVAEAMIRSASDQHRPSSLLYTMVANSTLAVLATAPLLLLEPVAAAATVTTANVLSLTVLHTTTAAGATAQVIALYRAGRSGSRVLAPVLAIPFLAVALVDPYPAHAEERVLRVLLASLGQAAAWAGFALRSRNEAAVHNVARQAVAKTLLEHTARGERARIARELHDVVAHHISMIAVMAETARLTTPGMPVSGAQRLTEIGDTARAGLTEMRRLLGVLREDADAELPDLRPQPGLSELNELIDHARDASRSATRFIVSGSPVRLDPGVELAAYRIVQEALTNARRHAPGAAVDVELHYGDESLRLRIRDNGPGPQPGTLSAGGHGLPGMRERALAAGGQIRTGEAAGGGFMIEAVLPTKSTERGAGSAAEARSRSPSETVVGAGAVG